MYTRFLKKKIEESAGYAQLDTDNNPVELIEVIRNAVCGRNEHRQSFYSLVQLQKMVMVYYQKPDQTNEDFKEDFEALWSTFEQQGGCM